VAAAEPAAGRSDSGQVERYELLRRRVLCGEPDGFRLGLAVLQRQGMAAWLKAWDGLDAVETPRVSSPPDLDKSLASESVVAVLASMTLICAGVRGTP